MIRKFEQKPIPDDVLKRVLDVARHAPSGGFSQGLDFIVLAKPEELEWFYRTTDDPTDPDPFPRRVIGTIALLFFSALRQAALYRTAGLAGQADLIFAFVLLADAAACMGLFSVWTVGWWFYHLLMLTAVCFALRALLLERLRGETFRSAVEGVLELGSEIPGRRS